MKVIFLQDVRNVAKTGEVKAVSQGYAQHFLIPRGLARLATPDMINRVKTDAERKEKLVKETIESVKKTAAALKKRTVSIRVKSKGGTLFGSVTAKDIAEELTRTSGYAIAEKTVVLKKHLKTEGLHDVELHFGNGIVGSVRVEVLGCE
jgi:large subunit ribosomal protein L9